MLLELSAVFDTMDHNILLSVLHDRFGVIDVALDWFVSYLSDRTQSSVRMGTERRFGPFKTTRLMVKFHQAHVIASEGLVRESIPDQKCT